MILVNANVVLVFEEYYNTDGYFTVLGRLANSFRRMSIDMIGSLVLGAIILGTLISQGIVSADTDALKLSAVILTNTIYEAFLVMLLAYGLVEFPRKIWNMSDLEYYLLMTEMRATQDYKDIGDFKINIQDVLMKFLYLKEVVSKQPGGGDADVKKALEVIQADIPPEFKSSRKCKPEEAKDYTTKTGQVTYHNLALLRTHLAVVKDQYKMAQLKVQGTQWLAYYLEDLVMAKKEGKGVIKWTLKGTESTKKDYDWLIFYKPLLLKVASVFAWLLSFLSFLGVVCSINGISNSGSPYFLAVNNASASGGAIVIFVFITLGYSTYVTLWSLFQMRFAAVGMTELVFNRTSPEGLSFNVRMVARLAAPLAFFYLGWIAENGLRSGSWTENLAPPLVNGTVVTSQALQMPSAFSKFYNIQAVKGIKDSFGTIYPVILFILMPLFCLNIFNRFFVLIKKDSWQFGTPIPTNEALAEGRRQLSRYKKLAERMEQRGSLKAYVENVNEKTGGLCAKLFGYKPPVRPLFMPGVHGDVAAPEPPKPPPALSGEVERRSSAMMGPKYATVFAEVRAPGTLLFFKDRKAADAAGPAGTGATQRVDLKLVFSFTIPVKGKQHTHDGKQLELDVGGNEDEHIKLRLKSKEEAEHWRQLLTRWKDWALDHGSDSASDIERGSFSKAKPSSSSSSSGRYGADDSEDASRASTNFSPLGASKPSASKANATSAATTTKAGGGGGGVKAAEPKKATPAPAPVMDDKPPPLEGFLEKKNSGKIKLGAEFEKRWCRVDEASCCFMYSKSTNTKELPLGALDLRLAEDVSAHDKSGRDLSRFTVEMGTGEKSYKFRAASSAEGERWITGLNDWRDYFLMNNSRI